MLNAEVEAHIKNNCSWAKLPQSIKQVMGRREEIQIGPRPINSNAMDSPPLFSQNLKGPICYFSEIHVKAEKSVADHFTTRLSAEFKANNLHAQCCRPVIQILFYFHP